MAHLYGRATNSSCLLCHQPDSQIDMLSGCQNTSIQNMVTERHNIASRLIIKTLIKGGDSHGQEKILEGTSLSQILKAKHGWLNKVWSCWHMWPTGPYPNGFYQLFSRRTSILLKARCYLHTTSWNEKWPSKRHTGCTPFALGCTPH